MIQINNLDIQEDEQYDEIIQNIIKECFKEEGLEKTKLYINIILTNEINIKQLNKKYRNIDKDTDVLSFPMFEKEEITKIKQNPKPIQDILGDVVISIPRVQEQAHIYGHSFERELAYMLVHSFYHLIGYDHIKEEDKKQMRVKEEKILQDLNIVRG